MRIGQREHPLPDRNLGKHPVDEVGVGVGHAAAATRRTEAATLAREGHEPVVAAGVAVDAEESMGHAGRRRPRAMRRLGGALGDPPAGPGLMVEGADKTDPVRVG